MSSSQRVSYDFSSSRDPASQALSDAALVDDFGESERFRRLQAETAILDLSHDSQPRRASKQKSSKHIRGDDDELRSAVNGSGSGVLMSSSSSSSNSHDHKHDHHHHHHHHGHSHACSAHSHQDAAHRALINTFIEQANIVKHVCQSNMQLVNQEKKAVEQTSLDLRWNLMHLLNEGLSEENDSSGLDDEKQPRSGDAVSVSLDSSSVSVSSSSEIRSSTHPPMISDSMKQAILDIFEMLRYESRTSFERITADLAKEIAMKDDIAKQLESGDLG